MDDNTKELVEALVQVGNVLSTINKCHIQNCSTENVLLLINKLAREVILSMSNTEQT